MQFLLYRKYEVSILKIFKANAFLCLLTAILFSVSGMCSDFNRADSFLQCKYVTHDTHMIVNSRALPPPAKICPKDTNGQLEAISGLRTNGRTWQRGSRRPYFLSVLSNIHAYKSNVFYDIVSRCLCQGIHSNQIIIKYIYDQDGTKPL